jgi:hypothetical protein
MASELDKVERDFHDQMLNICRREKEEAGRSPKVFEDMLAKLGGLHTAKKLLKRRQLAHIGFQALKHRRRADLTVEYLVLQVPWSSLFTEEELATARKRLAG